MFDRHGNSLKKQTNPQLGTTKRNERLSSYPVPFELDAETDSRAPAEALVESQPRLLHMSSGSRDLFELDLRISNKKADACDHKSLNPVQPSCCCCCCRVPRHSASCPDMV